MNLWILSLFYSTAFASNISPNEASRAIELKEFIQREKPQFEVREAQRRLAIEELDRLNLEQNAVRRKTIELRSNSQETNMSLENLSIERSKHRELVDQQKKQLELLLKVAYRVRRDGIVRYLVDGKDLSHVASRLRVLFYTLKSRGTLTQRLRERAERLAEAEKRLQDSKQQAQHLLSQLREQEVVLGDVLVKKRALLKQIRRKQVTYQVAMKEFREVSKDLAHLFSDFESKREDEIHVFPNRGSLPIPLENGRIVRSYGKAVDPRFQTVTYQKGIEIEAEQNAPVQAILPGVVEFEGWVKGLGNVVIVHHGGGFYSLHAHLFKSSKMQGDRVAQGEAIGLVGDTGYNEKPSLYFELRENGRAVDPIAYFSSDALRKLQ